MPHMFHAGVLSKSSWHRTEEVGVMSDANAMVAAGRRTNAWPTKVWPENVQTSSGLAVPNSQAIVADYESAARRAYPAVGGRYAPTSVESWEVLVRAGFQAGGAPTGAFSLYDGARVLATFDIGTDDKRTKLLLVDSFDGSTSLTIGTTLVDVVCANTLTMAFAADGRGMARVRHTDSLESKVNLLTEAIAQSAKTGEKVRETYRQAQEMVLDRAVATAAFDALFPEAPKDATDNAKTRAKNIRDEARLAASQPINNRGVSKGNLSTLWNTATYLVDRKADGSSRTHGSSDPLTSMIFGTRAKRVQEIQMVIEMVLRDGTVQAMSPKAALEMGADLQQVGAKVLEDMLSAV